MIFCYFEVYGLFNFQDFKKYFLKTYSLFKKLHSDSVQWRLMGSEHTLCKQALGFWVRL